MKRTSIQALKSGLSSVIAEAEAGETILITRHNRVVARLMPERAVRPHGRADAPPTALNPALREATRGRYLEVLLDDRARER